jgi:hypothetical protein
MSIRAITTSIGRIGHSHFAHPEQADGNAQPLRALPFPQLKRIDLLGGLIHEYEHAA